MAQIPISKLEEELASATDDAQRVQLRLDIFSRIRNENPERAEKLLNEILEISARNNDTYSKGLAWRSFGGLAEKRGDYSKALQFFSDAATVFEQESKMFDLIFCKNQAGKIYANLGDYSKAIDFIDTALRLSRESGEISAEANTLNVLSVIHQRAGNSETAEELASHAIRLAQQINNRSAEAIARVNLGNAFGLRNEWDKALAEWNAALAHFETQKDNLLISSVLGNLGIACQRLGRLDEAQQYLERCLAVKERLNDVYDIARSLHNLATVYWKQGRIEEAEKMYNRALSMGDKHQARSVHVLVYKDLSEMYKSKGDFSKALEAFERFRELEKALFTDEMNVKANTLQIRFDMERMEKEKEIYRLRNIDLAEANEKITQQKEEIEQKNKDITDSIRYAKRIQEAVLPDASRLKHWFGEHFVLFLPKDIVSGDFYWASEKNGMLLLAVADCTGHGVPGAIMSMMGSSFLTEIIGERGVTDADEVLGRLRHQVIGGLHQTGDSPGNRDGMDISLCSFSADRKKMYAACAINPVWIIRGEKIIELPADKFPVGIFTGELKPFTLHETELHKGDSIYLFTDGYADQFGGPREKKFGYRQLRELLLRVHKLPMNEQKAELERNFSEWKGKNEQIDDVCVIGISV